MPAESAPGSGAGASWPREFCFCAGKLAVSPNALRIRILTAQRAVIP